MRILGIETSGEAGNVALCEDDRLLAEHWFEEGTRYARDVMPAIGAVLAAAGCARREVEAVAVSQGPGSFTGLRVGVTCAKTLAYALGWKAVGVPSLEVKAQNVDGAAHEIACPVLDARRGWIYATVLRWDGAVWRDLTGVLAGSPDEVAESIPEGALVFGSGVRAYPELLGRKGFRVGDRELEKGRAEHVARLGLRLIAAGKDVPPVQLMPKYYRLTEVQEKAARQR